MAAAAQGWPHAAVHATVSHGDIPASGPPKNICVLTGGVPMRCSVLQNKHNGAPGDRYCIQLVLPKTNQGISFFYIVEGLSGVESMGDLRDM